MNVETAPSRILSRTLPGATVLQILPSLGEEMAARNAVNIAAALLRSGARAMIAGGSGTLVGELQALGGEWLHVATDSGNPLKVRSNARLFAELVATEHVDIVHAYSGPTAWSARAAAHRTGALFVTSYAGAPPARRGLAAAYQRSLARGQRIVADSNFAADLIARRHEVPQEHIVAIPPSIDTVRFNPNEVGEGRLGILRRTWRLRPEARVVLVPGVLVPSKGQMTAVDAARILLNGSMRGVVFAIAGDDRSDPDFTRAVTERIEAQGLDPLMRQIGHCPDMAAAYAISDLVVIPTLEPSTFDEVAAEAQAMGRLVVASSVGALPELVLAPPHVPADRRTGWLVPPADPLELARAISAALALPRAAREDLGAGARRLAERLFSPMRVAAATLAVYTALLEGDR